MIINICTKQLHFVKPDLGLPTKRIEMIYTSYKTISFIELFITVCHSVLSPRLYHIAIAMQENEKMFPIKQNFLTELLFIKALKLFKRGRHKTLRAEDLHEIWPDFNSRELGEYLEENWDDQKNKSTSVIKLLWRCFGLTFLLYGILQVVMEVPILIIAQPYFFGKIVSYFSPGQTELTESGALTYAILLISIIIFKTLYRSNYVVMLSKFGIRIRIALSSFLYRQILKLGANRSSDLSEGRLLTLITKDVQALEMFAAAGNGLWTSLINILAIVSFLYLRIGIAALVGVGCFILGMPVQMYLGKMVRRLKIQMSKQSDERLQLLQEMVSGIRLIKMYTWENFFISRIHKARKKEIKAVFKLLLMRFTILTVGTLNSQLGLYLILMSYIWLGHNMNGEIMYFITTIFQSAIIIFCLTFPDAIYKTSESLSATRRIEDSLKKISSNSVKESENTQSPVILFDNVSVVIKDKTVLDDIKQRFDKGLTIISGPVGSGKSLLLKTILGDYEPNEGNLTVEGTLSYSSQEPWLFPGSIKNNILFGQDFDPVRYQEVLRVCSLNYDLSLLKNGDETIVEDRGANLSRGQQARINLARAVYRKSDIYLLDDSLSGLDANVATSVFEECIKEFLQNKLVILATHNTKYFKEVNVSFIEDGRIGDVEKDVVFWRNKSYEADDKHLDHTVETEEEEVADETAKLVGETQDKIYKEKRKEGKVDLKTYKKYIHFGGGLFVGVLVLLGQSGVPISAVYQYIFFGNWVNSEQIVSSSNSSEEVNKEHWKVFYTYNLWLGLALLSNAVRAITIVLFTIRASIKIHKEMSHKLIHSVTEFFDKNFMGNILNRFSKDIAGLDEVMPMLIMSTFRGILTFVLSTFILGTVNPIFLIPTLLFSLAMIFFKKYIIRTTTTLKRLDLTTRSPVVGNLNGTLQGLTTIRALKGEETVKNEFDSHQNIHASSSYAFQKGTKAFTFISDIMSTVFNAVIILRFLIFDDGATSGNVGLAISLGFIITEVLNLAINDWVELENQMTSVERTLEYTEIKEESSQGLDLENWPKFGKISFENVYLAYSNSHINILHNINLTVLSGEKIGIVGRTGAGKSSLISALFRMYDIEGKVLIDDVNTKTLSLHCLRSNISIIPQDPLLFSGTIRDNIDPFRKYSDEEIWTAIEKVNLKKVVPSLAFEIGTTNLNLSVGEKQLLCIARAILQKNKIVVLDEATSSIDSETEKLIHQATNENFRNSTVLTIAHKLQTILHSDRIVVLDKGIILECDTPAVLLADENGVFFKMVGQAGLL